MAGNVMRYRINVPEEDESVLAWLSAQAHISYSLRILIKEDILRHGYQDVMNRGLDLAPNPVAAGPPQAKPRKTKPAVKKQEPAPKAEPVQEKPESCEVWEDSKKQKPVPEPEVPVQKQETPKKSASDVLSMFSGGTKRFSAADMGLLGEEDE